MTTVYSPISRVNLPLFTLIVRKGKFSETLIMRSWTWVKKRKKFVTWNVTETRKNGHVITEMWRKHDRSFPSRKHDGNASRRKDRVISLSFKNQIFPLGFLFVGSFCNLMHKGKKWNIFQQILKKFFEDISDIHSYSGSRWLPANFYTGPAFEIRNTN